MAMLVTAAAVTLIVAVPSMPSSFACAVVLPTETGVTVPLSAAALETVAMDGASVDQVTSAVTSRVVPSEYVAVALSGTLLPSGAVAGFGETTIDTIFAGDTVMVAVPLFPPNDA